MEPLTHSEAEAILHNTRCEYVYENRLPNGNVMWSMLLVYTVDKPSTKPLPVSKVTVSNGGRGGCNHYDAETREDRIFLKRLIEAATFFSPTFEALDEITSAMGKGDSCLDGAELLLDS